MTILEDDEIVQLDNSVTFNGVTLSIPSPSLKGSTVKIKQGFNSNIGIYYMNDTPVYGQNSQSLCYLKNGTLINQLTNIQASTIQLTDSFKILQIGLKVGSQPHLPCFNSFIDQIDFIINQGFRNDTFQQLLKHLGTAYDRKFINMLAGYRCSAS
ncbi:MAG: hypothetical protein BGO77_02755 [Caedibacter sp. 37-49]|nr:MAG: hypothetical protein BGO77_02755 [Caedibacter sp. 37-49]